MRSSFLAAAALTFLAASLSTVHAEVVTLDCAFEGGGGDRETIDVDLAGKTVAVTVRGSRFLQIPAVAADIGERYVTWPQSQPIARLDRRTGVLIDLRGIFAPMTCRKSGSVM